MKLGCVTPGESPAVFGDALRRLAAAATYLYQDGPRFWIRHEPEPVDRGTVWSVAFSPDEAQQYLYVMNGAEEKVHVLDHQTGKTLSTFGRPGHMLGTFTHGADRCV